MKKVTILVALALFSTTFFSCEKEKIQDEVKGNLVESYYAKDGVLYFSSAEEFVKLNDQLSQMNQNEIIAWEKTIGFTSFRSTYHALLDELDSIKTIEGFNSLLTKNNDVLFLKDSIIEPVIRQTSYQRCANRNGLFMIGEVLHKVTDSELLVFEDCCAETSIEMKSVVESAERCTQKISFEPVLKLKSSTYCGDSEMDRSSIANDRYCEAYFYVDQIPHNMGNGDIQYYYEVDCYSKGYAEGLFGRYYLYSTTHYCIDVEVVVEAPKFSCNNGCLTFSFVEETIPISSGTSSKTKTKYWIDGQRIGDYVVNQTLPDPVFKRVKGIFWTIGTGHETTAEINCGYGY